MHRFFGAPLASHASRMLGQVADIPLPIGVLKPIISAYSKGFGVDLDEVLEPEGGFRTFSDFFARRLRPGVRSVCSDSDSVASPCDGLFVEYGDVGQKSYAQFVVKGQRYGLNGILATDSASSVYGGGGFSVIYLHPRDYHRVHCPVDGELVRVRHVPGKRYPVNGWVDQQVDELYSKNERVVFEIRLASGGWLSVIMVAAFGVGNITSEYLPLEMLSRDTLSERVFDSAVQMERGAELGAFRLGSTVVMIWSENALKMGSDVHSGPVVMGRKLGDCLKTG